MATASFSQGVQIELNIKTIAPMIVTVVLTKDRFK